MIRFSIRHPVSILMALLTLVLLGGLGLLVIPVGLLPHLETRTILVSASYRGIAAPEMRTLVTIPLEDALMSLKGLKTVTSMSRDGLSLVTLDLHWAADADLALAETREIIDLCYETLPTGCEKPTAVKQDISAGEVMTIVLTAGNGDLALARCAADRDVKARLQRVPGVGAVRILGGLRERVEVVVRRDRMEARGLSLRDIAQNLSQANFEYPAGTIREGDKEILVKTAGLFRTPEDIRQTPVRFGRGGMVTAGDVAEVRWGTAEKRSFFLYTRRDSGAKVVGGECVKIGVSKNRGASPLTVSAGVRRELARLELLYGGTLGITVIADQADTVRESLAALLVSAGVGALAAFGIVFFFFRSVRLSAILVLVIPLCTLAVIFVLAVTGRTVNTMSLAGIALWIGMVIDSGAVVLENLARLPACPDTGRLDDIEGAVRGVRNSNIASSATTVVVFLPLFFLRGQISELFSDMAVAIITAIVSSCILSFTAIPALFVLTRRDSGAKAGMDMHRAEALYGRVLRAAFRRKGLIVLAWGLCLAAGGASLLGVRREVLPELATDSLRAEITFTPGTTVEYMQEYARQVSARLSVEPFVHALGLSGGMEDDDYAALAKPQVRREKITLDIALNLRKTTAVQARRAISALCTPSVTGTFSFAKKNNPLEEILETLSGGGMMLVADSPEDAARAARFAPAIPWEWADEFVFTPDRAQAARLQVSALYAASFGPGCAGGSGKRAFFPRRAGNPGAGAAGRRGREFPGENRRPGRGAGPRGGGFRRGTPPHSGENRDGAAREGSFSLQPARRQNYR
jgi:multidrug efflux pump subunit AcrB